MKKFKANAVEVNKSPYQIRYVFVLKASENGGIGVVTSYRSLNDNVSKEDLSQIVVMDLVKNELFYLKLELMPSFLIQWRENYFNYAWEIPQCFKTTEK